MKTIRFDELTRDELNELAPRATVVVPVGSTEQHGPHLPVCVDTAIITHLSQAAVRSASAEAPVVITPTLPFGFAHHHQPFGGTISLSMDTYLQVLTDIGRSLVTAGFRRILFINGHGGNAGPVAQITDRLVHEDRVDAHVGATSYWFCASDVLAELDLDGAPKPGHAGSFETSCLLALHPELVRMEKTPAREDELQPLVHQNLPGAAIRRPGIWQESDGRTDDSHAASRAIGQRVLDDIATSLSSFIVQFHRSTER